VVYVFVRYHHWLMLALMMKSFFEIKAKTVCIVVLNQSSVKYFENVGLVVGENLFSLSSFRENCTCDGDDEVVFHHSKGFLNQFLNNVEKVNYEKAKISFYADGYANRFLDNGFIADFLKFEEVQRSSVYFFDKKENIPQHLEEFSVEEIDSSFIITAMKNPFLLGLANEVLSQIKTVQTQKIIVMLRPWGSDDFQNGNFKANKNVLIDFIDTVYTDKDHTLIVRPDYRDKKYMVFVESKIRSRFPSAVVIDDKVWPSWLTFDVFLYYFSLQETIKPILISSDSTAASPFIKSKIFSEIKVGLPSSIVKEHFYGDDFIKSKIRMLKRIYLNYAEHYERLEQEEECFFSLKFKDYK
jgi:hypothetical protein